MMPPAFGTLVQGSGFRVSGFGFWFLVSGSNSLVTSSLETKNQKPETRNQKPKPETRNHEPDPRTYSYRSTSIGSTFAARCAGTKQAPRATIVRATGIMTKVAGSVALTLKSRVSITRVRAKVATKPMLTPASVIVIP